MNKIAVNAYDFVKDFASHHRKITAFQKIAAVSLIVGVSAVIHRNVFCLLICLTYLLSLACAIFITNHIIYTNVHVRSDMVLIFTVYFISGLKSAFSIIRSIFIEIFYGNGNSPQYKNENKVPKNGNQNDHSLHELSDELPKLQLEHGQRSTFDNLPRDPEGSKAMNNKSSFYLSCTEDEQESNSFYQQIQESGMTQDESKSRVLDSAVNQRSLTTDTQHHIEMENSMLQVDNSALDATGLNSKSVLLYRNRDIEKECTPELGNTIDDIVNNLLKLIHRDFVNTWYQMISSNTEAPDELYAAFESIAEQFKVRLSRIDYHSLAGEICCLFQKHVQVVRASSQMLKTQSKRRHSLGRSKSNSTLSALQNSKIPVLYSLEDCYDSKWFLHPALKNDAAEMRYIQSVTGILIEHCVPTNLHCSQTVQTLFNEILNSNIFFNVLHHLCEPVFIFEKIIQISSNEEIFLGDESSITSDNEGEATNTESIQSQNNVENYITVDRDSFYGYAHEGSVPGKWNDETLPEFLQDSLEAAKTKCSNSDILSHGMEQNIARISSKNFERIQDVSLPEQICSKEQVIHGSSLQDSKANLALVTETAKSRVVCSNIESCVDSSALIALSSSASTLYLPSGTVSSAEHTEEIFVIKETPQTLLRPSIKILTKSEKEDSEQSYKTSSLPLSLSTKCLDTVSLDEKNPSSPVDQADDVFETDLFDHKRENTEAFDQKTASSSLLVRLTDSGETTLDVSLHKTFHSALITATDTRKERGTSSSYTLYKVEYDAFYPDETGELVPKKGMVWRRFREFINLQVRLEDNSEYKKSLKGVKGPKRWQLPFRNMDKDTVETRKKVLETYLKCLIAKPDICNGPELKEFLGYEGDGRIAFVRRPSDVGVRRIDQMLVRTVSGVFDKIVERLPSLPQELPSFSGKKEETKEDDCMPSDDVDCIEIDFSISERQTQSGQLSLEHIVERYIQAKGQKTTMAASQEGDITLEKSCISADIEETVTDPKGITNRSDILESEIKMSEAELPVATHVLDILVEILSNHDSWVCRERVQTAARLVLGKALNRWLEGKVDFLISSEMVLFYLTTLQKTFWPEGEFVLEPRLKLTPQQEERIKWQAVNCLINFFPGALVKLIGVDDFEIAIEETLECLTHKTLNRHLWYCVIDLLIEKLFPEITMEDVHRSAQEKTA